MLWGHARKLSSGFGQVAMDRIDAALLSLALALLGAATPATAQQLPPPEEGTLPDSLDVRVLVLGTFHFAGSDADAVKLEGADLSTPEGQRQVEGVVAALTRFRPTKVAVEWTRDEAARLDSLYTAWREGRHELTINERQQLGFRVAGEMGHDRVWAVDWRNSWAFGDVMEYAKEHRPDFISYFEAWRDRATALDDSLRALSLEERLRWYNLESTQEWLFAPNLKMVEIGAGDTYVGLRPTADLYERNLRIFANLLAVTEPGDRVLVIFGASHKPFLDRFVSAHPDTELVDVLDFLP